MSSREALNCRACGSMDLTRWGASPAFPDANLTVLPATIDPESIRGCFYRCRTCGLGFRAPSLSGQQLRAVYSSMPSGQLAYPFETNGAWVRARECLLDRWPGDETPRILDVGCYDGLFLEGLPERWKKFGIESSLGASGRARDRAVEIIGGVLGDGGETYRDFFDVVCMFDVFEHLPEPQAGLAEALRYVKRDGLLLISTANMDSWNWRWLGPANWYLEIPLHISIGSPRFFKWFSRCHSVKVVETMRIKHRESDFRQAVENVIAVVYMGCKQRGGLFRLPQRLIQACPPWRHLMHRTSQAFTPHLKDHLLTILQRA